MSKNEDFLNAVTEFYVEQEDNYGHVEALTMTAEFFGLKLDFVDELVNDKINKINPIG
jgi:hypothetical protein